MYAKKTKGNNLSENDKKIIKEVIFAILSGFSIYLSQYIKNINVDYDELLHEVMAPKFASLWLFKSSKEICSRPHGVKLCIRIPDTRGDFIDALLNNIKNPYYDFILVSENSRGVNIEKKDLLYMQSQLMFLDPKFDRYYKEIDTGPFLLSTKQSDMLFVIRNHLSDVYQIEAPYDTKKILKIFEVLIGDYYAKDSLYVSVFNFIQHMKNQHYGSIFFD
jgi:hypothetical protein